MIKKYISAYKKLVNMPYNKLNLDNYIKVLEKLYDIKLNLKLSSDKSAIKLMSGQHPNAGIVSTEDAEACVHEKYVIVVGKGILFDSGGYDLKVGMSDMKIDMAGMACAIGTTAYLRNVLKMKNVMAICPVSTNFIHNSEITPGDVIPIGKKNVEVTDTDAEGRLVLADALSSFNQTKDDIIITVATLTGAVGHAVGDRATGVFTKNDYINDLYLKWADTNNELAWRLPMWDYLEKKNYPKNKKTIKNYIKEKPGATMATLFLKQFIEYPENWIHLDIAYSAYNEKLEKATGEPFRTIAEFIASINDIA